MMVGVCDILCDVGCGLVGGYSFEGVELLLGFFVYGVVSREKLMKKGGMRVGYKIIIIKFIGIGMLFVVDM